MALEVSVAVGGLSATETRVGTKVAARVPFPFTIRVVEGADGSATEIPPVVDHDEKVSPAQEGASSDQLSDRRVAEDPFETDVPFSVIAGQLAGVIETKMVYFGGTFCPCPPPEED
jgi:hypothetical protein